MFNEIIECGNKLENKCTNLGHTVNFGKHSEGKDSLYDMVCKIEPNPVTSTENSLKDDNDCVGLSLQKYLLEKGISAAYGRKSLGKDDLYSLISKIPVIFTSTFTINSDYAVFESITIGDGGGTIDWGDGTISTVYAGEDSYDHDYSTSKEYNIKISNLTELNNPQYEGKFVTVDLKGIERLNNNVFYEDENLKKVTTDAVQIGEEFVQRCNNLEEFIADKCTDYYRGVYSCNNIKHISLASLKTMNYPGIKLLPSLTSVNMPNLETLDKECFDSLGGLTSLNLPKLKTTGFSSLAGNNVVTLDFPSLEVVGSSCFQLCKKLEMISLPVVKSIGARAFNYCNSLQKIIFKADEPPVVEVNGFTGVPTTCEIFVPNTFLDDYKSAANMPDPEVYTYVGYDL